MSTTITTRREAAVRTLSGEITRYIGRIVSPGIGMWPRAWQMVTAADAAYLTACRRWIREGNAGGYQDIERAGVHLVEAWERADAAYRARGGPG